MERIRLALPVPQEILLSIGLLHSLTLLSLLTQNCNEIPLVILLAVVVDLDRVLVRIRCNSDDAATGNRLSSGRTGRAPKALLRSPLGLRLLAL